MEGKDLREALIARLHQEAILDEDESVALRAYAALPAWLAVLQGLAAWLAGWLLIAALVLPAIGFGESGLRGLGILLCGAALLLFRRRQPFTDQLALALSLGGQMLFAWFADRSWHDGAGQTAFAWSALLACLLLLMPATRLHRALCALLAALALSAYFGTGTGGEILALLLLALVVAACLLREQCAPRRAGAIVGALAPGVGLAVLALPAVLVLARIEPWTDSTSGLASFAVVVPWLAVGASVLLLGLLAWLLRAIALPRRLGALALALAACGLLLPAPGLIVAMTVFIGAMRAAQRTLAVAALLAMPLYLGEFYYRMDLGLLGKSVLLLASGLVLLLLRAGLERWLAGWER